MVWLAEHRTLHTKRIIKGIRRDSPAHDVLAAEAVTLMRLSHPGIPEVFDVDEDDEFTYIIEEFIEGDTLKAFYLKRDVSEGQLLDHLEQICSVLEYLQDRSVRLIHLDLKPENIMISDRVRIIDLGTAVKEKERSGFRSVTAGYTAPETIRGEETGKEGDVYSLGKLILFMVEHSTAGKRIRKKLEQIAKRCATKDRQTRVGSCVIVTKMLKETTKRKKSGHAEVSACMKKIAVIGLARGCGTTHVAVSLASVMAKHGPVLFMQKKRDPQLEEIFATDAKGRAGRGISYAAYAEGRAGRGISYAAYGTSGAGGHMSVIADLSGEPVRFFKEALAGFDLVILVGGGAVWRNEDYDFAERMAREKLLGPGCRVLMNMTGRHAAELLPCGIKAFKFPYEENPFSPGAETRKLFGKIVGGS